ncbi:hypothetical protein JS696_004866 [Escherichia coli]|nr:hypothetical protein [Escherichia coli]
MCRTKLGGGEYEWQTTYKRGREYVRASHAHLRINDDRGGRWVEYVKDTVIRES